MSERNVLYRFFDADDVLLYVGITMNAPARFGQHRDGKPWWGDVARIEMEHFGNRAEVAEAEIVAITTEKPLHNVVHNRDDSWCATHDTRRVRCGCNSTRRVEFARLRRQTSKGPLDPGQPVALCMEDGNCHVGMIDANDGTFLTITHKDWMSGFYWSNQRTVRVADVVEVHHCECDSDGVWRDDRFGGIQTNWVAAHRTASA